MKIKFSCSSVHYIATKKNEKNRSSKCSQTDYYSIELKVNKTPSTRPGLSINKSKIPTVSEYYAVFLIKIIREMPLSKPSKIIRKSINNIEPWIISHVSVCRLIKTKFCQKKYTLKKFPTLIIVPSTIKILTNSHRAKDLQNAGSSYHLSVCTNIQTSHLQTQGDKPRNFPKFQNSESKKKQSSPHGRHNVWRSDDK